MSEKFRGEREGFKENQFELNEDEGKKVIEIKRNELLGRGRGEQEDSTAKEVRERAENYIKQNLSWKHYFSGIHNIAYPVGGGISAHPDALGGTRPEGYIPKDGDVFIGTRYNTNNSHYFYLTAEEFKVMPDDIKQSLEELVGQPLKNLVIKDGDPIGDYDAMGFGYNNPIDSDLFLRENLIDKKLVAEHGMDVIFTQKGERELSDVDNARRLLFILENKSPEMSGWVQVFIGNVAKLKDKVPNELNEKLATALDPFVETVVGHYRNQLNEAKENPSFWGYRDVMDAIGPNYTASWVKKLEEILPNRANELASLLEEARAGLRDIR